MADYAEENKGSAFAPYQDQALILQGKLNVDGADKRFVVVKQPVTSGGEPQLVIYQKVAVLFANDKKGNEKAPDFSGPYEPKGGWRLAGWRGWSERAGHFLTLRLNPPQQAQDAAPPPANGNGAGWSRQDFDDEIPF